MTEHTEYIEQDQHPEEAGDMEAAALRADIATRRADLGRTVEALAAKTHVSARAQDAARGLVGGGRDGLVALPSKARSGAVGLWQRGFGAVAPVRRRLAGMIDTIVKR